MKNSTESVIEQIKLEIKENGEAIRKVYLDILDAEITKRNEKSSTLTDGSDEQKANAAELDALGNELLRVKNMSLVSDEERAALIETLDKFIEDHPELKSSLGELEKVRNDVSSKEKELEAANQKLKEARDSLMKIKVTTWMRAYHKVDPKIYASKTHDLVESLSTTFPEICRVDKYKNLNFQPVDSQILRQQKKDIQAVVDRGDASDELKEVLNNIIEFEKELEAAKQEQLKLIDPIAAYKEASEKQAQEAIDALEAKIKELREANEVLRNRLGGKEALSDDDRKAIEAEIAKNDKQISEYEVKQIALLSYFGYKVLPSAATASKEACETSLAEAKVKIVSLTGKEQEDLKEQIEQYETSIDLFYKDEITEEEIQKLGHEYECGTIPDAEAAVIKAKGNLKVAKEEQAKLEKASSIGSYQNLKDTYEKNKDILEVSNEITKKGIEYVNANRKDVTKESIMAFVDEYLNTHKDAKTEKFAKCENLEKLKQELVQNIMSLTNFRKPKKKGKNKKALLGTIAAFTGGLVGGLALSCVPGVGTIRTIAAGVKTAISIVEVIDKKFNNGRITAMSAKLIENHIYKNKHIPEGLRNGLKKIGDVLNNKYVKVAINGVAAGYLIGNTVELITGKTVFENMKASFSKHSAVVDGGTPAAPAQGGSGRPSGGSSGGDGGSTGAGTGNGGITAGGGDNILDGGDGSTKLTGLVGGGDPAGEEFVENATEFINGQTYDLSEIAKGYAASGLESDEAVRLITSAGKNAVYDRSVTDSMGKVWCHFKQANGKGYAWFPKEVVDEILQSKTLG